MQMFPGNPPPPLTHQNQKSQNRVASKAWAKKTSTAKDFVEAIEKYGVTEQGKKILLKNWSRQYARAIGCFQIPHLLVSGCAQIGKTLFCQLFVCYCVQNLRLNVLYAYAQKVTLDRLVPKQLRPLSGHWAKAYGVKITSESNQAIEVGDRFVSITHVNSDNRVQGGAAASGTMIGESADILFREERSQYQAGKDEPLARRLDASELDPPLERDLGTPGGGLGIEKSMTSADYFFYAHCLCEHCGEEIVLNPKGCLLKPETTVLPSGRQEVTYLDETGKPREWYCKDESNAVETAYFACPHCAGEISRERRVEQSYFRCLTTGVLLEDLLDELEG